MQIPRNESWKSFVVGWERSWAFGYGGGRGGFGERGGVVVVKEIV